MILFFYFIFFVNDIDKVIFSHVQKLADDFKGYRSVPTAEDIDLLQQDIHIYINGPKIGKCFFNVEKCKVLHIGHNNAY